MPKFTDKEQHELDQLKQMKEDINVAIDQYEMWKQMEEARQEEQQAVDEYANKEYMEGLEDMANKAYEKVRTFNESHHEVDKVYQLMQKLYEKPFGTRIPLNLFRSKDKAVLINELKKWWEYFKQLPLMSDKPYVEFELTLHDGTIAYRSIPLYSPNAQVRLDKIFKDAEPIYNLDQLTDISSDGFGESIYLTVVDAITFKNSAKPIAGQRKDTNGKTTRSHRIGAFFPYRIKPEYQQFEPLLNRYQIFSTYMSRCGDPRLCREELAYPCFLYALVQKYPNISNELLNDIIHFVDCKDGIAFDDLRNIADAYHIAISCSYLDDRNYISKWGSRKNKDGRYIPKDGIINYSIDLASLEQHYFIMETVPITNYYLKHYDEINAYAREYNKPNTWCWGIVGKRGNAYRYDTSRMHMSSLAFVRELLKIGAFEPVKMYDYDVEFSKVNDRYINKRKCELPMYLPNVRWYK